MLLFAIICITISVGYLYGIAHGILALGVCTFLTLVLRAVFRRIPVVRGTPK